jgi:hypothetical protein
MTRSSTTPRSRTAPAVMYSSAKINIHSSTGNTWGGVVIFGVPARCGLPPASLTPSPAPMWLRRQGRRADKVHVPPPPAGPAPARRAPWLALIHMFTCWGVSVSPRLRQPHPVPWRQSLRRRRPDRATSVLAQRAILAAQGGQPSGHPGCRGRRGLKARHTSGHVDEGRRHDTTSLVRTRGEQRTRGKEPDERHAGHR